MYYEDIFIQTRKKYFRMKFKLPAVFIQLFNASICQIPFAIHPNILHFFHDQFDLEGMLKTIIYSFY